MPWYGILLLILAALAVLFLWMVHPRLRRRPLGPLAGWDYAHRGLWNEQRPENSLPAFQAAVDGGFGIELDVHLTQDDVLVVFHDDTLQRMCGVSGRPENCTLAQLRALRLGDSQETIPTLDEVLAVVDGRVPLIVEIKADKRLSELCRRTRERLARYTGSYCVESFHPLAVQWFRKNAPEIIRGQLAYGLRFKKNQGQRNGVLDVALASLLSNVVGRPDFIAHDEGSDRDLPMGLMRLMRPHLVAWTVRSPQRMKELRSRYDLQIFEGFVPKD